MMGSCHVIPSDPKSPPQERNIVVTLKNFISIINGQTSGSFCTPQFHLLDCFQMFTQIVHLRGYIVTLVLFVWLFHYEFSNISSNCLPEMMHNHTGFICLTFLHCVFSNVSSNRLPLMMHNHIGCICLAFLQCVFSYVFSNSTCKGRVQKPQ